MFCPIMIYSNPCSGGRIRPPCERSELVDISGVSVAPSTFIALCATPDECVRGYTNLLPIAVSRTPPSLPSEPECPDPHPSTNSGNPDTPLSPLPNLQPSHRPGQAADAPALPTAD